jgi:hypothetical protein
MNIFQRLFGKKEDMQASTLDENHLPPQDLFTTDENPIQPEKDQPTERRLTELDLLLRKDFQPEGLVDGRELHDFTAMETRMQSIASKFRGAIRQEIEVVDKKMAEIEPLLNDKLKEAIPERYVKLNSRFNNLSLKKAELSAELELALKKEGICENAMISYRMGFERGFNLWSDETHFKL